MNKVLFCAHDPGGFDAVVPVYEGLCKKKEIQCKLLLLGAAAKKALKYEVKKEEFLKQILSFFEDSSEGILVTGTSWNDNSEILAIKECKEKRIKTVSILDFWSNYANRFKLDDGKYIYPDYYFVMDEIARKGAIADGIDPSIIQVTGQPGLDQYINVNVPKTSKSGALFLSQPLSELYGEKLGYTEWSVTKDLIAVCKEFQIPLHIKFHPKETPKYKQKYAAYCANGNLEEIASQYRIIIGMNTMGLLQCALMGASVISYQPELRGEELCITNQLGITQGAFSYRELQKRMRDIDKYSFRNTSKLLWMDGKSTERCMDSIMQLLV